MPEAIIILIGGAFCVACGYAGFLGGRDAAERKAYATVSQLRYDLTKARMEIARLDELNARLRHPSTRIPRPEVPEWMR